jgi:hypothetical protein
VKLVHLVGFIIKKSHIFVDTKGWIGDIQVNFRRDKKAIQGENRRIINRVTEVKNVDGTYRRKKAKG